MMWCWKIYSNNNLSIIILISQLLTQLILYNYPNKIPYSPDYPKNNWPRNNAPSNPSSNKNPILNSNNYSWLTKNNLVEDNLSY